MEKERLEDALMDRSGQITSNNQNNLQNCDVNNTQSNNSNNTSNSNQNERSAVSYTMPGILHYLQHEWNRYELDRQQWEVEKAEMMTKISFLQGERRGQENLKNNLVRRIKMLEVALKQERVKYHKLKFGVEPNLNELKLPAANMNNDINGDDLENSSYSIAQHPILNKENTLNNTTKQGRHILKQYLQEIGYTDTIIDVRSARLRTLLSLKSNSQNNSALNLLTNPHQPQVNEQFDNMTDPIANLINGNKQLLQLSTDLSKQQRNNGSTNGLNVNNVQKMFLGETDPQAMLMMTNLDFLSGQSSDTKKNVRNKSENNGNNNENEHISKVTTQNNSYNYTKTINQQMADDPETEDALKEFSFLSNESEGDSTDDGTDWNVDKEQLDKLTEQYKKDRKSSRNAKNQQNNQNAVSAHRPSKATLQAMIANLNDNSSDSSSADSSSADSGFSSSSTKQNTDSLTSNSTSKNQTMNLNFSNSTKMFLEEDGFASDSALGELSRISVNNSSNLNTSSANDDTIIDHTMSKKSITNKFSLRGHFDSVRCLAFHPTESALVTGSEDQTVKLWNLDKSSISNKKNSNADIESVYTFRRHAKAVLSVVVSSNGDNMFSSDLEGQIYMWNMPNFETIDQYDAYSPNVYLKSLNEHKDAVWSMILVDNTLVSISADSTIRVWNPFGIDELDENNCASIKCINESKEEGVPTSIDFIHSDKSKIVTSFTNTHHNIYDLETSKVICRFDYSDTNTNAHCYRVLSQPEISNSSSSLILSAHEDKKIRFFDTNSGKMVYQMVAHQDACTDLAIDPTSFYLLSASHDCSLRLWNLENKNCIQEMMAHRKKYDESIHCISFHPTKPFIASGGADGIVKIYV